MLTAHTLRWRVRGRRWIPNAAEIDAAQTMRVLTIMLPEDFR